MRKIRSVKPELLEDRITACLSHEAFRLFIGLTLLADDDGLVRAAPGYLLGSVFWGHAPTTPLAELIAELAAAGLAQPYQAEGDDYVALSRWRQHQRITAPHPSSLPRPPASPAVSNVSAHSGTSRGRGAVTRLARKAMAGDQQVSMISPDQHDQDEQTDHSERCDDQKVVINEQKVITDDHFLIKKGASDDQKVIIGTAFDDQNVIIDHSSLDRRGEEWIGEERKGKERINRLDHRAPAERLTPQQIDQVYEAFPRKVSKSRGYRVLAKVRASRFSDLLRAVANYARSQAGKDLQYVKQFGTWANEWEDWIEYAEPPRRLLRTGTVPISPPAEYTHEVDLGTVA